MTDEQMKLGEAEIIKALECCTLGTFACGKECPYYSIKSNLKVTSCRFELMCELSDLINRKNSELAELNNLLKLSNDIQNEFSEKIDEQKVEIERLKGWQDLLKAEKHSLIKAEAIKEFAERLKKEYADFDKLNEIIQIENLFLCIDVLVKEMTEIIP